MSNRSIAVVAAGAAIVLMGPVAAAAQSSAPASDGWVTPRTADGHPDLQGIWASDSATPLQRPEELADKATLSDEEVATLQARAAELFNGETDAAFVQSGGLASVPVYKVPVDPMGYLSQFVRNGQKVFFLKRTGHYLLRGV